MDELRYTLVTDGSSDKALIPILNWILDESGVRCPIQPTWADLAALPTRDKRGLADRIRDSLVYFPCDLLFVHRDAERATRDRRVQEISRAIAVLPEELCPALVCVVPVRMHEAWLLFDEDAIKTAAGNRRYSGALELPPINQIEDLPDPKTLLGELLRQASDLNTRRQKKFSVAKHARLVTEYIKDFSPLRQLSAFAALEEEVSNAIQENNWDI